MKETEIYMAFRKEIDSMIVESLLRASDVKLIKESDTVVGMMVLQNDGEYIDCLYILPEYRRKGIAEKFVRNYIEENKMPSELHIVHNNGPAKHFWNKVFDLEPIMTNEIDSLYSIKGVRAVGKD